MPVFFFQVASVLCSRQDKVLFIFKIKIKKLSTEFYCKATFMWDYITLIFFQFVIKYKLFYNCWFGAPHSVLPRSLSIALSSDCYLLKWVLQPRLCYSETLRARSWRWVTAFQKDKPSIHPSVFSFSARTCSWTLRGHIYSATVSHHSKWF